MNSRLDELQAAFLRVKLTRLDKWNRRRQTAADRYLQAFAQIPHLMLPEVPTQAEPVWHLFVVRHPRRDELKRHLTQAGIETIIHYPIPPHLSRAYTDSGAKPGAYPLTEQLASTVLSLPMGPHLQPDVQDRVIGTVHRFA